MIKIVDARIDSSEYRVFFIISAEDEDCNVEVITGDADWAIFLLAEKVKAAKSMWDNIIMIDRDIFLIMNSAK